VPALLREDGVEALGHFGRHRRCRLGGQQVADGRQGSPGLPALGALPDVGLDLPRPLRIEHAAGGIGQLLDPYVDGHGDFLELLSGAWCPAA
jgi:hypothetical protein